GLHWFVAMMAIPLGDMGRGAEVQAPLPVRDQLVLPNICYEDLFGEEIAGQLASAHRHGKQSASVLLNISNLAWFGDSIAIPQHLQISQMRSLETGRPMLRSTNTGATAVIDGKGVVQSLLPPEQQATLAAKVQGMGGMTPYILYGNKLVLALAALGALTLLNSALFLPETLPRARRVSPQGLHRTYARIALDRAFLLPALALSATFFFLFAYIGGASLVYQRDFGLSAGTFGLVFGATGVAVLLGAMASGRLVERHGVARLCVTGSMAMLGGAALALLGAWAGAGLAAVVPGMFVALFGLGIAEAALMAMAMGSQQRALGSTAALLGAIQMTLSSLATPLAASLSEWGPLPWLLFLTVAGLLVSWLTLATARVHPAPASSLGAH
ncbi:MAG: nitrilase-related carbon-nitrogen hydrolase, partial [Janthinobacterium sp.]